METQSSKTHPKKRILVVDDHILVREGLLRLLSREKDLEVCGEAASVADGLEKASSLNPDLVVVDITLERGNGLDLIKQLHKRHPKMFILVQSMHQEFLYASRSVRMGAHGYIMKKEGKEELIDAIRQVLAGKVHVSPDVNAMILRSLSYGADASEDNVRSLSDREFQIFRLIAEGYRTRQIAEEMMLSAKTVESHSEHIREKLNLKSTFELVQWAMHWKSNVPNSSGIQRQ